MADAAPTREDIYQAIRNADAAGDSASVQRLSQYLGQMDQSVAPAGAAATPGQYQGALRLPAMAATALAKGVSGLWDLPGNIGNALRGLLPDSGPQTSPSGADVRAGKALWMPGVGDLPGAVPQVQPTLAAHGLIDNPALVPATPLERYGSAGVEALPGIAASIATGGATLPMVLAGEGSAMAAQGAHDLAPDSPWAPVVAGLATGLVGGGVASTVENALTRRSTLAAVGEAQARLDAARDAVFQGGKSAKDAAGELKAASAADFAATRGQLASDLTAHNTGQDQVIETVANGLGKSSTLQEAGGALQTHARDWINNILPSRLDALWKPVDAAIPKESPTSLFSFTNALKEINSSAGKLEPLAALLKPSAPSRLLKAFENLTDNPAGIEGKPAQVGTSQILDAKGNPIPKEVTPATDSKPFSWGEVQKLRSTLGDAMSNPAIVKEVGPKNLSRLYATLTADMKSTAAEHGAGDLFDQANTESTKLYNTAEGPFGRLVASGKADAEDPAPEAVAKGLLSGGKAGASDLGVLRQEIPGGVNELAAANLRLNPGALAKMAPEAQAALHPQGAGAVLDALTAKEGAQAAHDAGVKLAQQTHQGNVEAMKKALADGVFDRESQVRSSSKALADAKAAAAALPGAGSGMNWGNGLFGGAMGNELAVLGLKAAGLPGSDLVHGALGSLVGGVGFPLAVNAAKSVIRKPGVLRYPALGGAVGTNALGGSGGQ